MQIALLRKSSYTYINHEHSQLRAAHHPRSCVAKQQDVTITFAFGVFQGLLQSILLHSSETFHVRRWKFPKNTAELFPWFKLPVEKSSGILNLFQKIAANLLTKDCRHVCSLLLFAIIQYYFLSTLVFHLLACSSTVVITKLLTSALRRRHMSAECLTCDLELSSNQDPRGIQSRGRTITLLSANDQICLLDDLKRQRSKWKAKNWEKSRQRSKGKGKKGTKRVSEEGSI